MRLTKLRHEFVESFPDKIDEGVVYISIPYATAGHNCACGCGQLVITPITPTDWQLTYNGETVSLHPSVGNWSFPCQSHYFIRRDQVEWSGQMSRDAIAKVRDNDKRAKSAHFDTPVETEHVDTVAPEGLGLVARLIRWFKGN